MQMVLLGSGYNERGAATFGRANNGDKGDTPDYIGGTGACLDR
jgi:hypothetical protein